MVKVIVHISKAIVAVILSLLCLSCGFDFKSVDGDGNVTSQKRQVTGTFTEVSAERGLEVIIQQGSETSVTVNADTNLQQHIKTEVKVNELKITADTNIGNGTKTITVVMPNIESLSTESSAQIKSENPLNGESMKLSSSSGSNIQVSLNYKKVDCETSSGAHIEVAGQTENLEASSSSGSNINAKALKAEHVKADASSGATTTVNPTKKLAADASSGGKVNYVNTPSELKKNASSGGTVSQL
jgi:hypothetical protein